ncbi:hypothetical protein DMC18_19265 [Caulobacter sp. D5]|uniref:hypothetical protein n=1 Tax=Caulobacter sp. D5 TaxID=357400 RepID=UPI000D7289CE|nr:hypothetical protein [Caulobacter sp. D5]PXA88426.1 hypothetical protein DMC18_19265 [Caulobacter sp. D5]
MAYVFGAFLCLGLSVAPYVMFTMLSLGAGRGEDHVAWFCFSLAAVVVGLLCCAQGWKSSRILAVLLGVWLLAPGALSVLLLWETQA